MAPATKPQARKPPAGSENAPRKRRKRTVVSGAPDDCFTCAREGTKCDRRRPYCSQCLSLGRECAGYKTTLTWGVGVASRGKLRGLSLPVTGSQPAANSPKSRRSGGSQKSTAPEVPTTSTSPSSKGLSAIATPAAYSSQQEQQTSPRSDAISDTTASTEFPEGQPWPGPTAPYASENRLWSQPYYQQVGQIPPSTMQMLPAQVHTPEVPQWPLASQSLETPESKEAREELERQRNRESSPWVTNCHSPSFSQLLLARSVGRTPRLQYLISYYAEVIAPMIVAFDSPTNPFRTYVLRLAQESTSLQEAIATLSTSNLRQRRERRMMSTERTPSARMSSLALRALTEEGLGDQHGTAPPVGTAQEEQFHRCMAVKALNTELADPHQRLSDSVLATLLILCLFHVCDTGVAQFKTQFAGVTKLLAIRMRASPRVSQELKWFIRMFTWYDTMTATTNDREVQLRGTCLDIATVSDGEWGLENLAGCDSGLFKLIAQLGRLNMLSQNQESQTPALPDVYVPSTTLPPSMVFRPSDPSMLNASGANEPYLFPLPAPPRTGDPNRPALSPTFWAEWFSYRQKLESWSLPSHRAGSHGFEPAPVPAPVMQAYISPPSSPSSNSPVAPENMDDVYHTSEAFRHAAILYTERLAYPDIPSQNPRIQHIVHRTMRHILAVKSDVYLLWPLFIIGSECVLESHRTVIQQRCKDISKDSGFLNNLSCLELLEKIWAESPASSELSNDPTGTGAYHIAYTGPLGAVFSAPAYPQPATAPPQIPPPAREQGFRWHKAMQAKRAEGEYAVV